MDPERDPRQRPGSALIARLRRWLRPPRVLRPTRAGWLFFVIIFGVGFAALNTGNNLLYLVLALMLAFLTLSGVLSEAALRGIEVRRRIPRELYAMANNPVQLEITNGQKRVPAFAIVVEDRLQHREDGDSQLEASTEVPRKRRRKRKRRAAVEPAGRCFALRIGANETVARRYMLTPSRRGPLAFSSFQISTRFPFGLFMKSREFEAVEPAVVFPEIKGAGVVAHVPRTGESGRASVTQMGQGGSVAGVREHQDGDSPKHVHWPTSLRRRALLVCQTEEERAAEIEVRLQPGREGGRDPGHDGDERDSRFENGVSRAATEVVDHLRAGHAVGLRTDATRLPAASGVRQKRLLLSFLAHVEADGRAPEPASTSERSA